MKLPLKITLLGLGVLLSFASGMDLMKSNAKKETLDDDISSQSLKEEVYKKDITRNEVVLPTSVNFTLS